MQSLCAGLLNVLFPRLNKKNLFWLFVNEMNNTSNYFIIYLNVSIKRWSVVCFDSNPGFSFDVNFPFPIIARVPACNADVYWDTELFYKRRSIGNEILWRPGTKVHINTVWTTCNEFVCGELFKHGYIFHRVKIRIYCETFFSKLGFQFWWIWKQNEINVI